MSDRPVETDALRSVPGPEHPFAPLRHRLFAVLWCATVIGNAGTFIRDVASGWIVTEMSSSPAAVALVQAAATLPVFLLAIPAGAMADTVDRRRFLIIVQMFLASVSATLTFLAATSSMTVTNLVLLTFLGGAGAALLGPTWQSIVPELVPKAELKSAVALNSLGFNIARAIGPALGGLLLATAGATITYGVDVVSYLFVIAALLWWKRAPDADDALAERFGGAVRAGLRYAFASTELRRVLLRTVVFFLFANVAWALMPVVARQVLGGGPGFYGVLLGATGAGAVAGAVILPLVRRMLDADQMILASALVMAMVLAWLSTGPAQWTGIMAAVLFGAAWITVLTTLNGTTQAILPNWVRGRGLATYLMAFNGAMTASSLIWGVVAEAAGVRPALLAGGVCLALAALVMHRFKLPGTGGDRSPSLHWPEPPTSATIAHDRGPVLITIEYQIRNEDRSAFLAVLSRFSEVRRRDGAYAWGVSEDAAASETVLEWFFVESWAEHLRQHRRLSKTDADLQSELTRFHCGATAPKVMHYLAIDRLPDMA